MIDYNIAKKLTDGEINKLRLMYLHLPVFRGTHLSSISIHRYLRVHEHILVSEQSKIFTLIAGSFNY